MIQRPQTILFILAALLVIFAAYAPFCTFSPDSKSGDDLNPRMVVSPSNLTFEINHSKAFKTTEEQHEKEMKAMNDEIDANLDKNKLSYLFVIGHYGMWALAISIVLVALMYKRRKTQIRLGFVLILVMVIASSVMYIAGGVALELLASMDYIPRNIVDNPLAVTYNYGFFLLPVATILMFIAVLLVRKDDNLIRSVDRIR